MSAFVRIVEVITGKPHRYEESRKVSEATSALRDDVQKLAEKIKPYVEADDPLVALMTDLFNQRAMRGNGYARSE